MNIIVNSDTPAQALTTFVAPAMSVFDATMIAEGVQGADEATQIAAWQLLIDTGICWQLQGSFGRMAAQLIEQGICTRP